MSIIESLILGVIQGLTEFLPVSSSGHLELAKALLGSEALPKESLLVTVILHFATALSTLFLFRQDVREIILKTLSRDPSSTTFTISIILSMLPAAAIGFFFEDLIDSFFSGNITLVGLMLVVTALLLLVCRSQQEESEITELQRCYYYRNSSSHCYSTGGFKKWGNHINLSNFRTR